MCTLPCEARAHRGGGEAVELVSTCVGGGFRDTREYLSAGVSTPAYKWCGARGSMRPHVRLRVRALCHVRHACTGRGRGARCRVGRDTRGYLSAGACTSSHDCCGMRGSTRPRRPCAIRVLYNFDCCRSCRLHSPCPFRSRKLQAMRTSRRHAKVRWCGWCMCRDRVGIGGYRVHIARRRTPLHRAPARACVHTRARAQAHPRT